MSVTYYSTQPAEESKSARAYGRDLPCSPKSGRNVAKAIKGMPVARAKQFLEEVAELKTAVPFLVRHRKIHHRKGTGFGPGKYPVQTVKCFLKVLESAEANAEYKGLDKDALVITHSTAYQGTVIQAYTPRAQGRATPHYNRLCNFEVILTQLEAQDEKAAKAERRTARNAGKKEARAASGKAAKATAARIAEKPAKAAKPEASEKPAKAAKAEASGQHAKKEAA